MASSRLPGKALRKIDSETPTILFLLNRIDKCVPTRNIVVATTTDESDDCLAEIITSSGFNVFRGHPIDLIDRYYVCSKKFNFSRIIRITGDCPFVCTRSLKYFIESSTHSFWDAIYTTKGHFPVGIDYELFTLNMLEHLVGLRDLSNDEKEHLTLAFYNRKIFPVVSVKPKVEWSHKESYTLDTESDLVKLRNICQYFNTNNFTISDLTKKYINSF